MADTWLKGLRAEGSGSSLTTPRAPKATIRRTSDDGAQLPTSELVEAPKRPPSVSGSRPVGPKTTPITPQGSLKPPLPAKSTPRHSGSKVPALNLPRGMSGEGSDDDESPRSRVNSMSADGSQADDTMEGDSVQVFVRVRPCNATEVEASGMAQETPCMRTSGDSTIVACIPGKNPRHYTYDKVLVESAGQYDVFEAAGVPMVDNCMSGYNSSIFVYGQTGAGKTFTMMGDLSISGDKRSEQRGLAPRMIELLFEKISDAENSAGRDSLKYSCRCSCLEIYNETITDLLSPAASSLQMREDPARGIYVDELSEKEVFNADDVMMLMWKGNKNRHVGETNMNARSSRSHCVFTCVVERTSKNSANGVTSVVCSRLNLIDLAGSERIKGGALGGSQAQGEHFKEAVHINQSLTTLGRVIMELVEAQKGGRQGQGHHIPYRDSRLTFLLQDSLGGNAKTMIIANVSPSPACAAETVSTLKFVARAKCIRNKATINLDYRGDVALLQKEIVRLNVELDNLRKGFTDPAIQENKDLRQRLKSEEKQRDEFELRMQGLVTENTRFKKEHDRMKARLLQVDEGSLGVSSMMEQLQAKLKRAEDAEASMNEASGKVHAALAEEVAVWQRRAEAAGAALQALHDSNAEQHRAMQQAREQLQNELATTTKLVQCLERETATLKNQAEEAEEAKSTLAVLYAEAREGLEAEKGRSAEALAQVAELEPQVAQLQHQCQTLGSSFGEEQQALQVLQSESASRIAALTARLEEASGASARLGAELAVVRAEAEDRAQELAGLKERLAHEQEESVKSKSGLIDRAAEQERKLRGELEHNVREQQSLRLQLAESELVVVAERGKVAALQAELAAAAVARQESEERVVELGRLVKGMELAAAETEQSLALVRQQNEELQQQLVEKQSVHEREQEESKSEVARLGAELLVLEGLLSEVKEARAAAEAVTAEQAGVVAGLRDDAERASVKHAAEVSELAREQGVLSAAMAQLEQEHAELKAREAAGAAAAEALQAELAAGKKALDGAQQKLQAGCADAQLLRQRLSDASAQQRECEAQLAEQQDRIRGLQREIICTQELLATRDFELGSQAGVLERLRREHAQVHAQLDAKTTELSDFRSMLAQRELEVAEAQQELKATHDGKSDMENQIKGFLVTNTRQARAFQEIRRLINWATTPTSSVTSSLARHDSSTPSGFAGVDDPLQSPTASTEPGPLGLKAVPGALSRRLSSMDEVDQPPDQAANGSGMSSFVRRSALNLDGVNESSPERGYGAAEPSPSQGVGLLPEGTLSKRLLVMMDQEHNRRQAADNDVLSPVAPSGVRDQIKCA